MKYKNCAVSGMPLEKPICVDRIGNLINKFQLLEKFVSKTIPEQFSYIKKLKDCKEVKVSFKDEEVKTLEDDNNFIICPITKKEFNGTSKFYALWTCGCVISKEALELSHGKCPVCNTEYEKSDLINLSLALEDQKSMLEKSLKQKSHMKKREIKEVEKKLESKISTSTNSESLVFKSLFGHSVQAENAGKFIGRTK